MAVYEKREMGLSVYPVTRGSMEFKVIVVIPVYYNTFSYLEKISLEQTLKVLNKYDKCFVIPEKLEVKNDLIQEHVSIVRVKDEYMNSIDSYSEMLCSEEFYTLFANYDYMLIAQIDVFIFEDKLMQFCRTGYDYIGAPWPGKARMYDGMRAYVVEVGNGGLSLRNIRKHIQVLKSGIKRKKGTPEDVFWAVNNSDTYKVAPVEIARYFSLEGGAEFYYATNNFILPMGCHAWWKVNYIFWKNKIEKLGYKLPILENMNVEKSNNFIRYDYLSLSRETTRNIIYEFINKNETIFIWGAGVYGEDLGWLLNKIEMNQYIYIDKYKKGRIMGKIIHKPQYLYQGECDNAVVIIANKYNYSEIEIELKQNNYKGRVLRYADILVELQKEIT